MTGTHLMFPGRKSWLIGVGITVGLLAGLFLVLLFLPSAGDSPALTYVPTPTRVETPTPAYKLFLPIINATDPDPVLLTSSLAPRFSGAGVPIDPGHASALAQQSRLGDGWPATGVFSPDGATLVMGTSLGVRILAAPDWTPAGFHETSSSVYAIAFQPNGGRIAIGMQNGTVELFSWPAMDHMETWAVSSSSVRSLAFSRPPRTGKPSTSLAVGTQDGSVFVRDVLKKKTTFSATNPDLGYWGYGIRSIAFWPDNTILVAGGDMGYISLWDLKRKKELPHLQTQHGLLFSLAFSPDGSQLASACSDGSIQVWDTSKRSPLRLLTGHEFGAWSVAFSPDGGMLAAGSGDGKVRLWSLADFVQIAALPAANGIVDAVSFSPDSAWIASVSFGRGAAVLSTLGLTHTLSIPGMTGSIRSAAFLPDNPGALLASEDGTVQLWNPEKGSLTVIGPPHEPSNNGMLAIGSPDGHLLAIIDGLRNRVRLLKVPGFAKAGDFALLSGRAGAFSSDNRWLAAAGKELLLVDRATGDTRRVSLPSPATSIGFLQNPHEGPGLVVTAHVDGGILLWDLSSGVSTPISGTGTDPLWSLTALDRVFAAGDNRGMVRIWDVESGGLLNTLTGHHQPVLAVALSPDGKLLASAGMDSTILVWDTRTGKLLASLSGHRGWINGLSFSPDGSLLLSAGSDGTARIWGIAP